MQWAISGLLIISAVIFFILYVIIYIVCINKKVRTGERKRLHLPSFGSVGFVLLTLTIITCLISCVMRIGSLENEVYNARHDANAQFLSLSEELSSLEERLKEHNSLFSSTRMAYGKYDKETHCGEITVTLIPKSIKGDTAVTLRVGEKEYKGERKGNSFVFNIKYDVVNDSDNLSDFVASVTSGAETQTQTLENMNFEGAGENFVPIIEAYLEYPLEYKDGKVMFADACKLSIDIKSSDRYVSFTDAKLIIKRNKLSIREKDISSYFKDNSNGIEIEIDDSYDAEVGDIFEISVIAHDSLGLTHNVQALSAEIQSDGYSYWEEPNFEKGYKLTTN